MLCTTFERVETHECQVAVHEERIIRLPVMPDIPSEAEEVQKHQIAANGDITLLTCVNILVYNGKECEKYDECCVRYKVRHVVSKIVWWLDVFSITLESCDYLVLL